MSIHTFGDSHSSDIISGWCDCSNIIAHHLGPILCYSFGLENLNRCDISKFNIKDNDTVIFCFGEIDCRCHIQKYLTNNNSYQTIINNIISNYINAIKINIDNCKVKLKHVCIYNIPPTIPKPPSSNAKFPLLGSDDERKEYGLYFNKCLKEKCIENNWIFFDVYNSYIDDNGFLNKKLSDGNVHIKNGIFLQEFINKYLS